MTPDELSLALRIVDFLVGATNDPGAKMILELVRMLLLEQQDDSTVQP